MNRSLAALLAGSLTFAAASVACGDGPDPIPTPTTAATTSQATVTTGTPTPDPNQVVGMSKTEFDALAGIQTSATGIRYMDKVVGQGPSPTEQQEVTIHYTGTLASNGNQFDTSHKGNGQPLTLQAGAFIPGFTEALLGMKEGGTRIVYIPAALAYRDQARSGIPPNSDLIFEIELLLVD